MQILFNVGDCMHTKYLKKTDMNNTNGWDHSNNETLLFRTMQNGNILAKPGYLYDKDNQIIIITQLACYVYVLINI